MLFDGSQSITWQINHYDRLASSKQGINRCSTNTRSSARDN
jgi:hypothetical protein